MGNLLNTDFEYNNVLKFKIYYKLFLFEILIIATYLVPVHFLKIIIFIPCIFNEFLLYIFNTLTIPIKEMYYTFINDLLN